MTTAHTPVIVSMTSHPARIGNVSRSIFHLFRSQTRRPDEVHLWLSKEQFPSMIDSLPEDLRLLADAGMIELHWLPGNTYVHKRHEIFKTVARDACVFFFDDDVIYNHNLIDTVMKKHALYPNAIICYNNYNPHVYDGKRIIYKNNTYGPGPHINKVRWCGQSMIPASIYPYEALSDENQAIRNTTSPISDECWMQPWIVLHDIPIYYLSFGWGTDIAPDQGKRSGLVSWSHSLDSNGYEKRDNWLNAVLSAYPHIRDKYRSLFNYESWNDIISRATPAILSRHQHMMHKTCDIDNPRSFTDKLEWLKLHDSTSLKTLCADKLAVKHYITHKLNGELPVIKTLCEHDSFDALNFSQLPPNYVLKTNHGSHTNIIVKNGNINLDDAKRRVNEWLSKDWSWWGHELHYIHIPRKVFIEEYIDGLIDYKFYCFNGKIGFAQVDRHESEHRINYYSASWKPIDWISNNQYPNDTSILDPRPSTYDRMVHFAKRLASDFKFVRVDFYEAQGKLYFGELTFVPGAAYITYANPDTDIRIGNMLCLGN